MLLMPQAPRPFGFRYIHGHHATSKVAPLGQRLQEHAEWASCSYQFSLVVLVPVGARRSKARGRTVHVAPMIGSHMNRLAGCFLVLPTQPLSGSHRPVATSSPSPLCRR